MNRISTDPINAVKHKGRRVGYGLTGSTLISPLKLTWYLFRYEELVSISSEIIIESDSGK